MPENKQKKSEESEVESKVVEDVEVKNEKSTQEKEVKSIKASSKASKEQNVVFVGNKPPMNYVMAILTAFNMGNGGKVTLKARGRAISTAVDVAEITRNRFFKETNVDAISIGTEQIEPREGGNPRNVSTIEISLKK